MWLVLRSTLLMGPRGHEKHTTMHNYQIKHSWMSQYLLCTETSVTVIATAWGEEMIPRNAIKSIKPEVSMKFCQTARPWSQKAEKRLGEGAMEDGTRHKKGRGRQQTGWLRDSPAVPHQAEEASRAHTCKYTRVNAEGLCRAYDSDCWLGTNINMAGATPTYGTMEGGCCFLPHFSFREKTMHGSRAFSNNSPFSSSVVWELTWTRRGPSLDWIISSESFY